MKGIRRGEDNPAELCAARKLVSEEGRGFISGGDGTVVPRAFGLHSVEEQVLVFQRGWGADSNHAAPMLLQRHGKRRDLYDGA